MKNRYATMSVDELLLIDLSSIAYPIWHMSQSSPDPNTTHTQVVDRVRALSAEHAHVAVCCDSGRSFRHDADPSYKAQRKESEATLQHQIALVRDTLANDGFPVWAVKGYEADDLIASATAQALAIEGTTVLIASADKDLLQLVGDRVQVKSLKDGSRLDAAWVETKFGVTPAQMRDYLSLVGDSSDNVVGAKGIGPKRACELLHTFGSIEALYAAIDGGEAALPPSVAASLTEFRDRWPKVQNLITLRNDVVLPFEEIATERVPKDAGFLAEDGAADMAAEGTLDEEDDDEPSVIGAGVGDGTPLPPPPAAPPPASAAPPPPPAPPAKKDPSQVVVMGAEWGKTLEPRTMSEAAKLANYMHQARLFSGYGSPQAVLSTILAGRELGLQAVASLRAFHIIESRHSLAADAMRALVLKSGLAKYFRIVERTDAVATFKTWRVGDDEETRLTFTIEQARRAWKGDQKSWDASGWGRYPEDMLVARASSKLARLVYPDILAGLYTPEELREGDTLEATTEAA